MNDEKIDELNKGIKILIFFVIILIVLVSSFFAVFMLSKDKETTKTDNKETTAATTITTTTTTTAKDHKLFTLGTEFYEGFYWNDCGKNGDNYRKEYLDKFKDIGIKVNIDNLIRYNSDDQEALEYYFSDYDTVETRVIFYPKKPYGVKDYTIKLEIVKK